MDAKDVLRDEIKNFLYDIAQVQILVRQIGTEEDCKENREQLHSLRERLHKADKSLNNKLTASNFSSEEEYNMVMDDFRKLQATSRALYRESFQKEKQYPLTSPQTYQHFSPSDSPKLLQAQKFASKGEVMNQIIEERNERIKEVVTEVKDLHEAVRATGTLIHDTAPALDVIEANINTIEHDTEEGFHAIASASKEQNNLWPVSGSLLGIFIGGALGSFLGPLGTAVGSGAGVYYGTKLGYGIETIQKEQVDKIVVEQKLRDKWVPDEQVTHCGICKVQFTAWNRKHHCRTCGGVFCGTCSSKKLPFEIGNEKRMERACDKCHTEYWSTPY